MTVENRTKDKDSLVYRFGAFELEPRERRLTGSGGAPIALTPKVFDTLVLLVERAGHAVSKNELMQALWPRGYVDEATLSNHIWQIRRALGDTAKSTRFIETIPKLGYRFCAPVTSPQKAVPPVTLEPIIPARTPPIQAPAAVPAAQRRRGLALAAATMILLAAALLTWHPGLPWRRVSTAAAADRTVAVVGFNNLSQAAKDAWLAPALTAMLAAELGAADHIRVLPDEVVRDAIRTLGAPLAGGYGRATLAKLRERLSADYVVSGSYLVAASADPSVRVDVELQDAKSGALIGTLSHQADLAALNSLVNQAGATLRERLGGRMPSATLLALIANAQPPTTDVARRLGLAQAAMERYDAARARDELLEAVAEAPGFAPSYLYLSRAWSALGYRQKALAAAEQAASRSAGLPPEIRLQIDAAVRTENYDWTQAAQSWQALVALKPLTLEYRFEGIDAEIAAGDLTGAQAMLAELRRLPQAAADPRVDLAAARLARARDDAKSAAALAADALREAKRRDVPGLIADAQIEFATAQMHLGQYEQARSEAATAITAYGAIGNPRGEVAARRLLAALLSDLNRTSEAREEYQHAMALAQRIGDSGGVALVYRDLSELLWLSGDRDGAQVAGRQALAISRETGDLKLQAWTLRALATIAADEAATDEVMANYREVTELTERSHDPGGHVWSLATNADLLRQRGELRAAEANCERAQVEADALSDPQFAVYSGFVCAELAVDRGATKPARGLLDKVERLAQQSGSTVYAANAELLLGQLDFEEGQWSSALEHLRRAAQGYAAGEAFTGEANAEALLAVCAQAAGDSAQRDRAAARAKTLRAAITSQQEIYFVDIALAQLADGAARQSDAVARLKDLAADAERRHWRNWSLEAKVAEWRMLRRQGQAAAADALKADVQAEARQYGFDRVVTLLDAPPANKI